MSGWDIGSSYGGLECLLGLLDERLILCRRLSQTISLLEEVLLGGGWLEHCSTELISLDDNVRSFQ